MYPLSIIKFVFFLFSAGRARGEDALHVLSSHVTLSPCRSIGIFVVVVVVVVLFELYSFTINDLPYKYYSSMFQAEQTYLKANIVTCSIYLI